MAGKSEEDKYLNKSLDKALSVIDLFSSNPAKLSATEIANKMDSQPGTIYPTLFTLEKYGYLHRDGDKKYSLGLKFLEKGSLVLEKMDLRAQAHPELEKLRDETNETIHLGVLDEGEVVYIDKLEPQRAVRMYSSIGKRVPVHATALGKAILAYLPEDKWRQVIKDKGLTKYTSNTITTLTGLAKELESIRKQGYAIDDAEHEEEIRCISAPIFKHTGSVVAALSVTTPASRVSRVEIREFKLLVIKYGQKISQKLGLTKRI